MSPTARTFFGAVSGDGIVTLNDRVGHPSLRAALAPAPWRPCARPRRDAKPDRKLADVKFLPVIPQPEKILCAGINYRSHAAETGRELPKQPSMFIRFTDTLVGHDGAMIRPSVSDNFDYEGELAVVIGKAGRHIAAEHALDHVAGYTCFWSTAACATIRNSPSPPARIFPAPARSGHGSSPPTRFPIRASSR